MNELLQKHGCANVFTIPEGLKELMSDISREVLREQPAKMLDFIANYLSVLLITREHGILAVKILDDLCDCRPSVSEHLLSLGFDKEQSTDIADVIKQEIEGFEPVDGSEKLKETQMLKKIMKRQSLDEEMTARVCQVARNAYRDYWYRKKLLEQKLKEKPEEPWERAAAQTLEIYKRTRPSFSELTRAAKRIQQAIVDRKELLLKFQAAYRGYHVRKKMLKFLNPRIPGPKLELPGPPLDIAASREMNLGPIVNVQVKEDDVVTMFSKHKGVDLGLKYDPLKAITHVEEDDMPDSIISRCKKTRNYKKSRAQSFAQEVLGMEKEETPRMERNKDLFGILLRPSVDANMSREMSSVALIKKISFSGKKHEIIPIVDTSDDISEEIPETRSEGDGDSEPSLSSDPVTADMVSDIEEVDEDIMPSDHEK